AEAAIETRAFRPRGSSVAVNPARPQRAGIRGLLVLWAVYALAALAVLETYWRIPPGQLWKVHNTGFVGGLGRALVFLSFSPALGSIAILSVVVDPLDDPRANLLRLLAAPLFPTAA